MIVEVIITDKVKHINVGPWREFVAVAKMLLHWHNYGFNMATIKFHIYFLKMTKSIFEFSLVWFYIHYFLNDDDSV